MTDAATGTDAGPRRARPSQRHPRAIAVDGSAASGKSTIGRRLALALGWHFLDTGIMYRAVTQAALARNVSIEDAGALTSLARDLRIDVSLPSPDHAEEEQVFVDGVNVTNLLRAPEVEASVSLVSRVAGVRAALVRKQRMIAEEGAIVMAGRDIGTVVLPDAALKVYLDASLSERSRRRHQEFHRSGRAGTEEEVMDDIRRRDQIDSEREVSPLRPAHDAVVIRTDGKEVEEVLEEVIRLASTDKQ